MELKFQIEFAFLQEMPGKAGWLSLNFGVDFLLEGFIVCINFAAWIADHFRIIILS